MSRLHKKCVLGATTLHALLLLALLVGPGFFSRPAQNDVPLLEIIPDVATDADFQGGGAPRVAERLPEQPTQPVQPPQPVTPPPPEPEEQKVERVEKPPRVETEKPEVEKNVRPDRDAPVTSKTKTKPHEVTISKTKVKITGAKPTSTPNNSTAKQPTSSANSELASAIAKTGTRVRSGLSSTVQVDMPEGFGGGGASYANYTQIVRKIYNDAWNAWSVPDDLADDEATVKVSVTIARNGRVISSRIVQSSGSRAVINGAQAVLDRVSFVKEFPADSKDAQRTFTMTFKLNARKLLG